ncbi:MAG TPA: hypothetical protein VN958_12035, partial [Chitinophagaceae bacterium]|nr:hypothetical protein [Chitinophagaceae bacterium]
IEKDSWISINGNAPFKNGDAIQSSLDKIPSKISFSPPGYFVSSNHDLLIVYGKAVAEDNKKQGYMRVWKRNNNGWKLILMVLS